MSKPKRSAAERYAGQDDYIRGKFAYEPDTGIIRWRVDVKWVGGFFRAGEEVIGAIDMDGYRTIGLLGSKVLAHMLAWFLMTGAWPDQQIDHRDTIRLNNKWANLRKAVQSQQACNSKIRSDNTSGVKGVSWLKRDKKWRVRVNYKGKRLLLGDFDDFDEAVRVRTREAQKLYGEFYRVGKEAA